MYTTQFEAHVSPVRCLSQLLITESCSWRRQNSLDYQLFNSNCRRSDIQRSSCWILQIKKICLRTFAALIHKEIDGNLNGKKGFLINFVYFLSWVQRSPFPQHSSWMTARCGFNCIQCIISRYTVMTRQKGTISYFFMLCMFVIRKAFF